MSPHADLTERLIAFRDARDWKQFHGLKDLLLSLNLEASELLELAQWKRDDEVEALISDPTFRENLADESADVFLYLLLVAEHAGIDLIAAAKAKMAKNEAKYPVEKSRGNATKYTNL